MKVGKAWWAPVHLAVLLSLTGLRVDLELGLRLPPAAPPSREPPKAEAAAGPRLLRELRALGAPFIPRTHVTAWLVHRVAAAGGQAPGDPGGSGGGAGSENKEPEAAPEAAPQENDGDDFDPALALGDVFHWMAPHMENSPEGIPDCPEHPGAWPFLGSSAGERWQDFLSLSEPLGVSQRLQVPPGRDSEDVAGACGESLSRAISHNVSLGEAALWVPEASGRPTGAWSPPGPEGAEAMARDLLFDLGEVSFLSLALEEGFEPLVVPRLLEQPDSDSGLSLDSSWSSGSSASLCEDEGAEHPGPRGAAGGRVLHNHTYYLQLSPHRAEAPRPVHSPGLPFSPEEIASMPVESFNSVLACSRLSATQVALLRDIRRRGKNKVAAQNCRRRKLDVLLSLEREVGALRAQRDGLRREAAHCHKALGLLRSQLQALAQDVFRRLQDEQGQPVNPELYALHCDRDGSILVLPKELAASSLRRENPKGKGGK